MDGSPEPSSPALVARLAEAAEYVVVADRGAIVAREAGVVPDVFCGDADSASGEAATWASASAQTEIRFPSEKYATDLALALDCARHEAARQARPLAITLTCSTGGRLDHQLAVVGLLAAEASARPRIVEDGFECRLLSPEGEGVWKVGCEEGAPGATLSVIALAEGAVVSESGMQWNLDHATLPLLGDLGVSNVVQSADARVECHAGVVAVFLLRQG